MLANLIKNYRYFLLGLVILLNLAFCLFLNLQVKSLQSERTKLKTEIFNKNLLINQLEFLTARQNEAIAEMEKNANEKANLDKELKKQREKILKDLKTNDEVINEPLHDSIGFIIARLRAESTDNQ